MSMLVEASSARLFMNLCEGFPSGYFHIVARRSSRPSMQPLRGGQPADIDRRYLRACAYASAPRGMQPVSHLGE
jgi:hypothetical protein